MKISCCVIFKNEEKHLPKWIECAKALGDEIIAVDTGSSDKSRELLETSGIVTLYYKWNYDFASAKNFAIDRASGDWIVFLDADEYFLKSDISRIKQFIQEVHNYNNILAIENVMINIDEDEGDRFISKIVQMRIFRNIKELRYKGEIHEKLYLEGNKPIQFINSDIPIYHTGYSRLLLEEKGRRNLELLKKDLNKNKKVKTDTACHIANCYMQLNNPKEAAKYAKIALKGKDTELKLMAIRMCQILIIEEDDNNKKLQLIEKAVKRFGSHPDLLFEKGKILYFQEKYNETIETFKLLLQQLNNETLVAKYETSVYTFLHFVFEVLADIAYKNRDVENAKKYIAEALKLAPNVERIKRSYEIIWGESSI